MMMKIASSSRFVHHHQKNTNKNHRMIRGNRIVSQVVVLTEAARTGCTGSRIPSISSSKKVRTVLVKATETSNEYQTSTTSTSTTAFSSPPTTTTSSTTQHSDLDMEMHEPSFGNTNNTVVEVIEREIPGDERNSNANGNQSFWEIEAQEEKRTLGGILKYPDELYSMLKIAMEIKKVQNQIPEVAHWAFCYSMLNKVSKNFALLIQQLHPEYRNAVCIFYLVLRALDTIEDDMSIATDVKIPMLKSFHQHIYDGDLHFSCGTEEHKALMDGFHHISAALRELERGHQEAIEDTAKRMGAGMAKFLCKEVETIDDYDEYCHYASVLPAIGLSKIFGVEDLVPYSLVESIGALFQKTTVIRDYLEDINEIPKSRMYWPREIWSKYVNKLEDLKYKENSEKAVQCLNEMVTNALSHVEGSIKAIAALQNHAIFQMTATSQTITMGILALCYNNVEVFRGEVKMRLGLIALIFDKMSTMADVYGANYDFAGMIKQKIDKTDPNAAITLQRVEAIQKFCMDSGTLDNRKLFIARSKPTYNLLVMTAIFVTFAFFLINWR